MAACTTFNAHGAVSTPTAQDNFQATLAIITNVNDIRHADDHISNGRTCLIFITLPICAALLPATRDHDNNGTVRRSHHATCVAPIVVRDVYDAWLDVYLGFLVCESDDVDAMRVVAKGIDDYTDGSILGVMLLDAHLSVMIENVLILLYAADYLSHYLSAFVIGFIISLLGILWRFLNVIDL